MRMGLTETLGMLPEARRFVVEGARLVMQQRAVVQNLELDGYETLDALRHLELLEGMQAEYIDRSGKTRTGRSDFGEAGRLKERTPRPRK